MISPRAAKKDCTFAAHHISAANLSTTRFEFLSEINSAKEIHCGLNYFSGALPDRRGCDFDSRMVVSQVRHWNMSKSSRLSRDLAACMATPQRGQGRMAGRRFIVMKNTSMKIKVPPLIQINADANRAAAGYRAPHAPMATDLDQGAIASAAQNSKMWQTASNAPFDCDLELAVIDKDGQHALVFPCRRILGGWINAANKERLDVRPTHWRLWTDRH